MDMPQKYSANVLKHRVPKAEGRTSSSAPSRCSTSCTALAVSSSGSTSSSAQAASSRCSASSTAKAASSSGWTPAWAQAVSTCAAPSRASWAKVASLSELSEELVYAGKESFGTCSPARSVSRSRQAALAPFDDHQLDYCNFFDEAPDLEQPYVVLGGGQPRGMSTAEQIQWMSATPHPDKLAVGNLDEDLLQAMQFEIESKPQDVDRFRAEKLRELLAVAEQLQQQRLDNLPSVPAAIRPLVAALHVPLVAHMAQLCGHEDTCIAECLQKGFAFAGHLPECKVAIRPGMPKPLGRLSVQNLRDQRSCFNANVLAKLKNSEWSEDLLTETHKDVAAGAMRGPWPLKDIDIGNKLLSRRMPVREERQAGWKTVSLTTALRVVSTWPHRQARDCRTMASTCLSS